MTLYEYRLRIEAHDLAMVDKERDLHWQAWLNWNVQATKKSGNLIKPAFKTFKDFFNYEGLLKGKVKKPAIPKMKNGLLDILRKQNERRKSDG